MSAPTKVLPTAWRSPSCWTENSCNLRGLLGQSGASFADRAGYRGVVVLRCIGVGWAWLIHDVATDLLNCKFTVKSKRPIGMTNRLSADADIKHAATFAPAIEAKQGGAIAMDLE